MIPVETALTDAAKQVLHGKQVKTVEKVINSIEKRIAEPVEKDPPVIVRDKLPYSAFIDGTKPAAIIGETFPTDTAELEKMVR